MKTRYICLALLACLSTSASAQRIMNVKKADGTLVQIPVTDVQSVFFTEEALDAAVLAGLCPDNHHPHQIDMGTAGIWSCCNVGASAPWGYGGYYAWGETEEKSKYDWETYKYGYYNDDNDYSHLVNIGSDISGTQYDAATANWGALWRLPTYAEFDALSNCTSKWTRLNGVSGHKFTGSNGNSIFLPAAGYRADNELRYAGSNGGGFYWSSTLVESDPDRAYSFYFYSSGAGWGGAIRSNGRSVRPVFLEKPVEPDAAVEAGLCPDNHHPHQIDMGTAGIWSCCNVGSSAPWDAGGYYAWGETEEKSVYKWSTYLHCDGSYDTCHDIGTDISGTQYDAATVNWGTPWRMPTSAECKALVNCFSEWMTLNGVKGRKFMGSSGNSIFLPAAGHRWDGELGFAGSSGNYWSSTLYESYPSSAYLFGFTSSRTYWYDWYYRYYGLTVRPVFLEKPVEPDAAVKADLCPDNHHPHQIDMGEAGIWSCCNVGASVPWGYGGYYAWGETAEKSVYNWETYQYGYYNDDEDYSHLVNIGSDISGTSYDAARANWGTPWRMPTLAECEALVNCTSEWTTLNDVNGRKFTGSNGNSIFLPAAGVRWDGELGHAGDWGNYWSSTLNESRPYGAYGLGFYSGDAYWGYYVRYYGQSVRPVR